MKFILSAPAFQAPQSPIFGCGVSVLGMPKLGYSLRKDNQVERDFLYFLKWRNADWLAYVLSSNISATPIGQIHCWYIEPRNREKSLRLNFHVYLMNGWQKYQKKKKFHDGFLR